MSLGHAGWGLAQSAGLTSNTAGVDLKRVTAGREGYVAGFLPELRRAFTRLATFERPVVAAVNGHAIGGGSSCSPRRTGRSWRRARAGPA